MNIDILTIFPKMFTSPFNESILKRAQDSGAVTIKVHDLRDWTTDNHRSVDDRPYGGGAGMVMRVDVIDRALAQIVTPKAPGLSRTALLSAKGKAYSQQQAEIYSHLDQLVLVAGHYEGVDERVAQHLIDDEIRVGDYVLTGGELPAMIVVDSIVRLLPGVLGNELSAVHESHSQPGYLEHPHYTRPAEYKGWQVPEVLLNGHHAEIEKWRVENSHSKLQKKRHPQMPV